MMQKIPDLYSVNDGKLSISLHYGQAQAWQAMERFILVLAGTQGGKTSFAPLWLSREIEQCGHGDYLAATATYDLFKLKLLPDMRKWFVTLQGWNEDKSDRVFWKEYKPRMFTRIILRAASSEGGLESMTAKAAVLDEFGQDVVRVDAWEAVQRRLALNMGRALIPTTPYNLGWLKTQVYDRWLRGEPDYRVIQFKSIDNPAFPRAAYEHAKSTMPDWKFRMFYNGEFIRPAGLIYGDFNPDIHVKRGRIDMEPRWARYVGLDFGAVNQALLWLVHNPHKNHYIVYRESLESNKTTNEHAAQAKRVSVNENVVAWVGGAPSETQQRMDWRAAGIYVQEPRIIDVESGIDHVIELFKTNRLFVHESCTGLIDELGTYSRELNADGQPTDKIRDKSAYHRLDCLRYIASILGQPEGVGFATAEVTNWR
jgi:hypothetical protein